MSKLFRSLEAISKRFNESNDCTVKALAIAAGLAYEQAHRMLSEKGRKPRGRFYTSAVLDILRAQNRRVDDVTPIIIRDVKTISAFQNMGLKDTYIIQTSGHVLVSKGGEIHDWTNGRRHGIIRVYRVI